MPATTDPSTALALFQQGLAAGHIPLQRAALDRTVFFCVDQTPSGSTRFTYMNLDGPTISAFVSFITAGNIDGVPCFQVGYAVPEAYRGRGHAKSLIAAGIAELKNGLSRSMPGATFYVEAVVGADNEASQHVAAATLSASGDPVTDEVSGLPAFHYLRKF